jgi:hypothetical protein
MTRQTKNRWRPAIDPGCIGERLAHMKPPGKSEAFGGNLRPIVSPDGNTNSFRNVNAQSEKSDDDIGGASRYCNPAGFPGLHRNVKGKNEWFKTGGQREVKRQTQVSSDNLAVKRYPFK